MRRARVLSMLTRGQATPQLSDAEVDTLLATPNGRTIADMLRYSAVGTPEQVRTYLTDFAGSTGADELIVAHQSRAVADRLRSVELTAVAMNGTEP